MVSGRLRRPPMRRRERGAAVFVVVMAITLLTAVGLFAAHSATLVDQASGHARLARQTVSLAEYGTLAAAAELGSGAADAYVAELSARTEQCRANVGRLTENPPCYKLFLDQLDGRTRALADAALLEPKGSDGTPGSLGTSDALVGDFVVELTDPGPTGRPVAGTDAGGTGTAFRYLKVTATTTAQVRTGNACTEGVASMTSEQSLRAQLLIGPLMP